MKKGIIGIAMLALMLGYQNMQAQTFITGSDYVIDDSMSINMM